MPRCCAARVAAEIARLLGHVAVRDKQTGVPRRVRPGDIAHPVPFARRGTRRSRPRSRRAGIPSYVYKGLGFFDADEIKDLVALLRYLADPASDLRAAAVLRSRFVRLSDAALQALAPRLADALAAPVAAGSRALDVEDQAVLGQARPPRRAGCALVDRMPPADLLDRGPRGVGVRLRAARARGRRRRGRT